MPFLWPLNCLGRGLRVVCTCPRCSQTLIWVCAWPRLPRANLAIHCTMFLLPEP